MSIVNESDINWSEFEHGETRFKRKQLGQAAEGEMLGCSLYELPPGHKSWPYHYHTANEEALFVIQGNGTIQLHEETHKISEGDYVSLPSDESGGHSVINNSDSNLRYLVFSTMNEPDVTVYPDSDKFGVFVGSAPGGERDRPLEGYYKTAETVDYWDGE